MVSWTRNDSPMVLSRPDRTMVAVGRTAYQKQRRSSQTMVRNRLIHRKSIIRKTLVLVFRYVLLKERNRLLTMEEEYRHQHELFPSPERIDKVRSITNKTPCERWSWSDLFALGGRKHAQHHDSDTRTWYCIQSAGDRQNWRTHSRASVELDQIRAVSPAASFCSETTFGLLRHYQPKERIVPFYKNRYYQLLWGKRKASVCSLLVPTIFAY